MEIILLWDNFSKYGHITIKFVGKYFYWVVTIFSKNGGRKKIVKIGFRTFKTKKKKKKIYYH